ncbi:MAG: hypothetical protein VYA30_07855 [Myxococcota bacterium]|nr:hypothetical protein [Myxococcota bacterium]
MNSQAPGKVILFGEYAVLDGYDALVVAVDRHVQTRSRPQKTLQVDAGRFGCHPPKPHGLELPFIKDVVQELGVKNGRFDLSSTGFECSEGKLGLGSSAASTVSFVGAALTSMGRAMTPETVYKIAQTSHRRVQGLGSGIDVAASTLGGSLWYNWDGVSSDRFTHEKRIETEFGVAHVTSVTTPITSILTVWTGQPANTKTLVKAVHKHRASKEDANCMAQLGESAKAGRLAWTAGQRSMLISAAQSANEATSALGHLTQVGLWTESHQKLSDYVGRRGCVKTTGAGGGDLAWVIGSTQANEQDLEAELSESGYLCFRLKIDNNGLSLLG